MTKNIAWAAAFLLTSAVGAGAQTPASTATPPAPAAPAAASPSTVVPEATAPAASSKMAATATAKLSKADQRFVMKAASGGLAEVQAAQLAEQKAQDSKVKDFAQKMITDHTANNTQLSSLAQQKGVDVPGTVDAKDQKELDKLSKLDGSKFDKMYLKGQVRDHEAMLKLMQTEAKSGKDPDLKAFAAQTAPVVQSHLDMAKSDSAM